MSADVPDYKMPPGQATPGAASRAYNLQEQILQYLQFREDDGKTWTKSNQVATALEVTLRRASGNLRRLRERGLVERWGSSKGGSAWRLTEDGRDA